MFRSSNEKPMFQITGMKNQFSAEVLYKLASVYSYILPADNTLSSEEMGITVLKRSLSIAEEFQENGLQSRCLSRLAQKYIKRDLSYAAQCASKALALSQNFFTKAKALNPMGGICQKQAKCITGIQYVKQQIELAQQIGNRVLEATGWNNLGCHYGYYVSLQKEAFKAYEKSIIIREKIGSRKGASLSNLGKILRMQGRWQDAEEYLQKAIMESHERGQLSSRHHLGYLFMLRGNYTQAQLEFLSSLEGIIKYKGLKDERKYARLALNYGLLGNNVQCRKYLNIVQTLFDQETDLMVKFSSLFIIADAYRLLKECELAQAFCQHSLDGFLANAEVPEDLVDLAEARLIMGKILVDLGAYEDALDYLDKAQTAFAICQHYALGETLLYLGKAYQGLGGAMFWRQAKEHILKALAEFQRLELHHKECEAQEVLKTL